MNNTTKFITRIKQFLYSMQCIQVLYIKLEIREHSAIVNKILRVIFGLNAVIFQSISDTFEQ